jgi:UDP-glucose 4-epimerase
VDAFTDYYPDTLKRMNIRAAAEDPNYVLLEGDLLELDLADVLSEVSVVFHLAAQPGVRASWDYFRLYTSQNVAVTQRLLDAARGSSVERVVIASSSSIYGDAEALPTREEVAPRPVSPYGVTKVAAEHLAHVYWRNFGVPTVCLRYFTVYGPRQRPDMAFNRLIACGLAGSEFEVFGDGNQTRDFTYVSDVVDATVAAAERGRPGAAYNIGGGSRRSMNSVIATLAESLGMPLGIVRRAQQAGDARDTAADITRARVDLGFVPAADFTQGIKAQLEWQETLMTSTELRP